MQFTPKKRRTLSGVRFNPYASGGRAYLGQYKQNIEKVTNSTPRKKTYKPGAIPSCRKSLTAKLKSESLTDENIEIQLAQSNRTINKGVEDLFGCGLSDEDDVDPLLLQPLIKPVETYSSAKQKKSVLSATNEPFDAIPDVENDKENKVSNFTQSNSFYRKETTPKRSSILHDISPVTVKNAYQDSNSANFHKTPLKEYKFKKIDKENVESVCLSEPEYPHMIGFPNYGNTCYLNSVMQALMGLLPFVIDLCNAQNMIKLSTKSITMSLSELICSRQKCSGIDVKKALRFLKENMERVDEAFAGFKMQDANEFLTQILDSVKDEIDQYIVYPPSPSISHNTSAIKANENWTSNGDVATEFLQHSIFSTSTDEATKLDNVEALTLPETSTLINPVIQNFGFELLETCRCLGCSEMVMRTQDQFALYVDLPKEESILNIQKSVEAYMREDQREVTCEKCGHNMASVITRFTKLPRILIVQLKRYEYNHEQFECSKVSAKVDLNMWLYLGSLTATAVDPAPPWMPQTLVVSNDSKEIETDIYFDAFASPVKPDDEIIPDSVATEPAAEEFEINVEELQIVPLTDGNLCDKEEEDLQLAIKLSLQASRMCYSTDDTSDEASSEEAFSEHDDYAYRLLSVISHFGQTTSTGHYVADVLNCQESQWYHYDDETVAKLQETVLLAEGRQKNAYIYFYADKSLYEELSKTTS